MIVRKIKAFFNFQPFSSKQLKVLTWWCADSPVKDYDGIIADGAIRSGKTISMALSYVIWAIETFNGQNFALCGKTIGSFKRNVWFWLKLMLWSRGYHIDKFSEMGENVYIISKGEISNIFYIFGGKDERSQDLIQGITLAGILFDEVALMPESFVNQATGRCSVDGSKFWFNGNPAGPMHWFKLSWIDKVIEKRIAYLHFTQEDNLTLSDKMKERYRNMYVGVFFKRYILGLWVMAEGVIYSMFEQDMVIKKVPIGVKIINKWIGIDYGQSNATTFILTGLGNDNKMYILDEYYHSGKDSQIQKSPRQYSLDFKKWLVRCGVDGIPARHERIFIDPSAKGFMLQLNEDGVGGVRQADNDVLRGIELISSLIASGNFRILERCKETIKELNSYRWDEKAQERGEDKPIKQYDHCLDGLRYVCNGTRKVWQRIVAQKSA